MYLCAVVLVKNTRALTFTGRNSTIYGGKSLKKPKIECWGKIEKLFNRFVVEYGEFGAKKIFEIIMQELGNDRVTISFSYYKKKLRNQKIRGGFNGYNYDELSELYNLTPTQISNIIHSDKEGRQEH